MIQGVEVKNLKAIPDERGFLMEILRADDPIFERFGQVYITSCKKGIAKAWHYHKEQSDHFVCLHGTALVVLYDIRKNSPTFSAVEEYILRAPPCDENESKLLKIPPQVAHGFTALGCDEARILNIPTKLYRYDDPDEYRFSWNSKEIPYSWPSYVVNGG
jgi:dTDP-4-dehydrorhamnose 3,5-epimerase